MITRHKRIDAHFRPEDEELYQFVKSQVNGWGDTSQAIRRFVEIARLFNGSLTEARDAANALIIVNNQYDSVANAMVEHSELFKDGE